MEYKDDILAWREAQEADLRQDIGWLTLAGLHWLKEGENSLGSDPSLDVVMPAGVPPLLGTVTLSGASVSLKTGVPVHVDGKAASSAVLSFDEYKPTRVELGSVMFIVIERGGQYAVRVWDKDNPARAGFKGRHWYEVREDYRVTAALVPHPEPVSVPIDNTVGQNIPMTSPGKAVFALDGQQLALDLFVKGQGGIWVIFKDKTNGSTSYGAGRYMDVEEVDAGHVLLDFNKAYSPPCSFTSFATCPIPPRQNHLPLKVEAGEMYTPDH
jgi:uncharacterized protein (DUF1684 family)